MEEEIYDAQEVIAFNRTSMELKHACVSNHGRHRRRDRLLIEPVWN